VIKLSFLMSVFSATHLLDAVMVQACISHLHGLTSLQVADIDTPVEPATLDRMLACLTALKIVSLEFQEPSESDLYDLPQDVFPCSLLRLAAIESCQSNPLHRPRLL
jgi:hypothetical protein